MSESILRGESLSSEMSLFPDQRGEELNRLERGLERIHSLYRELTSAPSHLDLLTLSMAVATSLDTPWATVEKPIWLICLPHHQAGRVRLNSCEGLRSHQLAAVTSYQT